MKKVSFSVLLFALLSLFIASCSKDEGDDNNNNNNTTGTCSDGIKNQGESGIDCGGPCPSCNPTGDYFQAIADSQVTQWDGSNSYNGYSTRSYPHGNEFYAFLGGQWLQTAGSGDRVCGVYIAKNFAGSSEPSRSEINAMFYTGSYGYGDSDTETDGAIIWWADETGDWWWSDDGDQTGSTFTITSRTADTGSGWITIEGTFSCKLYNSGHSITLTNGKFKTKAAMVP